ncbi:hypothetical protein M8C21_022102 [Ambrosia artemisiifolia]|uniref:Uncharacterized protein n=1 Tax=Ambrosia artemisiifolia TaxID=4212 RepID=A0AAD5GLM0_AMBAR|nr:hypothetical protein M8C21_022102 [Ambrosia artemisiifolia]
MLPWLVIPLIVLWLLSQFLPPAFRFEITSPRLACVVMLLATLLWYEILMPWLSAWRARRNARIIEKRRLEVIEMQEIKNAATKRCRNCKTAYQVQDPTGGKFKCCHCGHSSKKPLLDTGISPGLEQSGVLKDLVGKVWVDNNWMCGQDWLENGGYWVNGSFTGKKNSVGVFNRGNDNFFSFLFVFVCKSLAAVFLGIMWLFRKLFRTSLSKDEDSSDTDISCLAKKGGNEANCSETRSQKAHRKAEEKRQARLEREKLEEEERKQREEVAHLVEERRKIREETDKKNKALTPEKSDKNEVETKRHGRKKEKNKGYSKSNSHVDDREKRSSKEINKKQKGDADSSEHHKSKVVTTNNKGSVGERYLDRRRGNSYTGGIFGRGGNAKANTSNTREHKSNAYLGHANKRDFAHPERTPAKSNVHADDQSLNRPMIFKPQPCPPPIKSWNQLFDRSPAPVSSTSTNVSSRPITNENPQTESQSSMASSSYPVTQGFDNRISQGLPFPQYVNSTSNIDRQFSSERVHREPEIYEDPGFVADPASLIGPVSDSLDNFPVDLRYLDPMVNPRTPENTKPPVEDHGSASDKGWQTWNSSFTPDALRIAGGNPDWSSPKKASTSDNLWAPRTPYESISGNNKRLSMNFPESELGYGNPMGSAFNYPFQLPNDSVWTTKPTAGAPVRGEGIGSTSGLLGPGDGLRSPPVQMYSNFGHMNEKDKEG